MSRSKRPEERSERMEVVSAAGKTRDCVRTLAERFSFRKATTHFAKEILMFRQSDRPVPGDPFGRSAFKLYSGTRAALGFTF